MSNSSPRPEGRLLIPLFALAKLLLHLATSSGYGYFRDELYYLACAEHLDFGYVDHPSLSIFLLWIVRHTLGTSLLAIRFLPAVAGAATVALVGWMARRMGGGRLAQALAMTCALIAGSYLAHDHFYSMNAFELLLWAAAAALLVRLKTEEDPQRHGRIWIALGIVLALGLANKISVLWLGAGLGAGMLLGPERRWLATRWPWIAGGIAALGAAPYAIWNFLHDWPTPEFIRNASGSKMAHVSPLDFLHGQYETMHPWTLPLWLGGLAWLFFHPQGKRFRLLGWIYLVVLAILVANGTSRSGYLAPAYTWLFAAGGNAAEGLLQRFRGRWPYRLGWAAVVVLLAGGVIAAPFALPVIPVERYVAYAKALGVQPETAEKKELGDLPQHFADMHGWPEIVATIEGVYRTIPDAEKPRTRVYAPDYGIAGAIDLFGPPLGLPKAISGHNSYWLWGPGSYDGGPLIVVGGEEKEAAAVCTQVERAATIECGRCMPYENHRPVWLCRGLKVPIGQVWKEVKNFS
jgi:hypothetical protein